MKTSQADCYRLAQRCLDLLSEIEIQMNGYWDTAPPLLIKNLKKFEQYVISPIMYRRWRLAHQFPARTLQTINGRFNQEAESKWYSRITRKSAIADALSHYNVELDDAARSFQVSPPDYQCDIDFSMFSSRWCRCSTFIIQWGEVHHFQAHRAAHKMRKARAI